jgi:hypothetical protein
MGTRALADAAPGAGAGADVERTEQLAAKHDLLTRHRPAVSMHLDRPGVVAAEQEAATIFAVPSAVALPPAPGAPWTALEALALSVPEDLCVLLDHDGGWRLDSGVVCFPSLWRLGDKIGHPLADIHGPVPAYAEELAARVDRLVARLRPGRPVWRRNWFVHHDPALHQPEPGPPPVSMPDPPEGLWLRSERQTLHRLPATGAVVFTIRTQQVPLAEVAGRPDVAGALAAVIAAWPDELVAYRGAGRWRAPVVSWLLSRA